MIIRYIYIYINSMYIYIYCVYLCFPEPATTHAYQRFVKSACKEPSSEEHSLLIAYEALPYAGCQLLLPCFASPFSPSLLVVGLAIGQRQCRPLVRPRQMQIRRGRGKVVRCRGQKLEPAAAEDAQPKASTVSLPWPPPGYGSRRVFPEAFQEWFP